MRNADRPEVLEIEAAIVAALKTLGVPNIGFTREDRKDNPELAQHGLRGGVEIRVVVFPDDAGRYVGAANNSEG